MKKIFITILTIFIAYVASFYSTDAHKKHDLFDFGNSNILYKLGSLITGETDTTDALSVFQRGLKHLDYQEFDAAIRDFDKALQIDSNFIFSEYVYEDYFSVYLEAHDTTKAISFLEYFIKKEPYNYDANNRLADIYIKKRDFIKAESYLQSSIRINSDYNADAFSKLAILKYANKNYKEALALIDKAIVINSYFIDYYNTRRLIYIKLNEFDLAKIDYDYIISQDYDYFPDYFEKGKEADDNKNYQEAIENYKLALTISPNNREILNKKGWAYIAVEKYDSACYDFDTIAKYFPDRTSYFNKAYAEDYIDKIEEAIADYTICIGYDSAYYLSYMNRGYEYYRLKKYRKAEKDYTRSIELKSDYSQHYYNRGLLYFETKKYKKAIADYQNALLNSPNNSNITYDIALAYDKLKNRKNTVEYFSKYLEIAPEDELSRKEHAIKRIEKLSK